MLVFGVLVRFPSASHDVQRQCWGAGCWVCKELTDKVPVDGAEEYIP